MHNYNYIYCKCYNCMIIEKNVVLRIMNLALMTFLLLPCGLKHTPFILLCIRSSFGFIIHPLVKYFPEAGCHFRLNFLR